MNNSRKLTIYIELRRRIIECVYLPNSILSEEGLAEEFQVSRTPIRDAIARLEQEKLLKVLPKVGIQVSDVNFEDIVKVFELRLLLEPYALLNYANTIPQEKFIQLYKDFDQDFSPLEKHKLLYEIDDRFHMTLIRATKNHFIIDMYKQLSALNQRIRIMSGTHTSERIDDSKMEHVDIVQACLCTEWNVASRALKEHLLIGRREAMRMILNNKSTQK